MMRPNADILTFALPRAEELDISQPSTIIHGCDYFFRDDGVLEVYYNFLDYHWSIDGTQVRARHYLDGSSPLKVAVMMAFQEFNQPKYAGVLDYLQRRFHTIETFERDESKPYVVPWMLGGSSQADE